MLLSHPLVNPRVWMVGTKGTKGARVHRCVLSAAVLHREDRLGPAIPPLRGRGPVFRDTNLTPEFSPLLLSKNWAETMSLETEFPKSRLHPRWREHSEQNMRPKRVAPITRGFHLGRRRRRRRITRRSRRGGRRRGDHGLVRNRRPFLLIPF